jgi:hypothetical protein
MDGQWDYWGPGKAIRLKDQIRFPDLGLANMSKPMVIMATPAPGMWNVTTNKLSRIRQSNLWASSR